LKARNFNAGSGSAISYGTLPSVSASTARVREWVMEFEQERPRTHDPLMGWTSSADTRTQVRLRFASEAEAIAYAER